MKTQLLEDIGQSAGAPLAPSKPVEHAKAGVMAQGPPTAGKVQPARPRSATGVWRQKPAEEPPASPTQQLKEPAPLALDQVFEEIAALEAQFVQPGQQHAPAIAQVEPEHEAPSATAKPLHAPVILAVEDATVPNPTRSATAPQDPLFDFTQPLPAPQDGNPVTAAPTGLTRSRQRHLLVAAGVLSVALLVLGGRWLYQERSDAGSVALIATQAKERPLVDAPVNVQAIAKRASTPEPDGAARVEPAVPASSSLPAVPPLVMLELDPPAAIKPEQALPSAARGKAPATAQEPAHSAKRGTASPPPKPSIRKAREPSRAAARPAKERPKREPVRQLARAPAIPAERPPAPDTSMAALLRACREHGYHATQCIKRECSVTAYGFACRGR